MEQERAFKGEKLYANHNEGALVTDQYSLRVDNAKWFGAGEAAILSDHFYLEWMMFREENVEYARPGGEYVTSHAAIFVPPGQRIRARWKGGRIRNVSCCFLPELLNGNPDLLHSLMNLDGDHLFNLRSPFLQSGMTRIAEEAISPGMDSDFMVRSILQAICSELSRTAMSPQPEPDMQGALSPSQLQMLQQLLRDTNGKLPLAEELAQQCGVMPRALSTLVKGATGVSLRHYVAKERLSRAKDLLDDRKMLIKQISFSCGFSSPAAFAAAFRKATGMTPAEYRNRC